MTHGHLHRCIPVSKINEEHTSSHPLFLKEQFRVQLNGVCVHVCVGGAAFPD